MAQNVTIAGNQYPSVPSILIPKTGGGGNATFTDTSPTTASASDVAQGKIFFDSTGSQQTGTASGGGGTDFIVTLSYDSQSDMWLPDKTFAEIVAAFTGGKTIGTLATYNGYIITSYGECLYDNGEYYFAYEVDVPLNYGIHSLAYILTSDGIYDDDDIWTYSTSDATALPADVANGKIFYNANGRQTGTASGGGGSSMNVQVAQSTTRASSSTYTSCVSLTCSTAGTYDVYWSCFRSSTSGTSGSQLHVGSSAYGTENTTFTNHIQNNHLTGVQLSANQSVAVYARSRGNNYYAYIGTLTIKQTA